MGLPITRILRPTDFSDPSYEALKSALELCANFSADLSGLATCDGYHDQR
jgi:hypothetical protein